MAVRTVPLKAPLLSDMNALTDAVAAYMNRTDLDVAMGSFISIAEAQIALDLRHYMMVKPYQVITDTGDFEVPDDWLEWDRLASNGYALDYIERPGFYDTYQYAQNRFYTMVGNACIVGLPPKNPPTPAPTWTINATYYQRIAPLSDAAPVNWLLTRYPHIYLYACLVSACQYVKDDQRATAWGAQYKTAVDDLNSNSYKASLSGSQWRQRPR